MFPLYSCVTLLWLEEQANVSLGLAHSGVPQVWGPCFIHTVRWESCWAVRLTLLSQSSQALNMTRQHKQTGAHWQDTGSQRKTVRGWTEADSDMWLSL